MLHTSQTESNLPDYNRYPHHGLESKNSIPGNFSVIRRTERTEGSAAPRWLRYCELAVSTQRDSVSLQHTKKASLGQELTENHCLVSEQCPLGCSSFSSSLLGRRAGGITLLLPLLPLVGACLLPGVTSGTRDYHSLPAPQ